MASSSKFTPDQDYPDLSKHSNHMSKHLSKEIYGNLRDKKTASGFTLDECIQTGKPRQQANRSYNNLIE